MKYDEIRSIQEETIWQRMCSYIIYTFLYENQNIP